MLGADNKKQSKVQITKKNSDDDMIFTMVVCYSLILIHQAKNISNMYQIESIGRIYKSMDC